MVAVVIAGLAPEREWMQHSHDDSASRSVGGVVCSTGRHEGSSCGGLDGYSWSILILLIIIIIIDCADYGIVHHSCVGCGFECFCR
jgi:hypothetical protein